MRLILTRHYRTQSNEAGRIIGWGDSPPGNDWKRDIDYVDARLQKHAITFDRVYSSALERSRQTAVVHATRMRIAEIISAAELNEINYGDVQEQSKSEISKRLPGHKKDPDLIYPRGESFRQMQQRSVAYLTELAETHPQQTVLVVGHAGVIRGIVSHFLKLEYGANLKRKISFCYIGDFLLDGGTCVRYDELGEYSGFVSSGAVQVPYINSVAAS